MRRRFYQLRIMDFLVRELSLEHEVQQFSRLPPALAAAAVAGLPLTPKSGALKSAAAAAAAGASSKTPTIQVPSLHGEHAQVSLINQNTGAKDGGHCVRYFKCQICCESTTVAKEDASALDLAIRSSYS